MYLSELYITKKNRNLYMLSSYIFFMTLNKMKLYFHALFIEKNRSNWEQIFGANRGNFLMITHCFDYSGFSVCTYLVKQFVNQFCLLKTMIEDFLGTELKISENPIINFSQDIIYFIIKEYSVLLEIYKS